MEAIRSLVKLPKPSQVTERGMLLTYFRDGINRDRDGKKYRKVSIPYVAKKVQELKIADLYYMKSVIESETRRGQPFGKLFFGMLKPKV